MKLLRTGLTAVALAASFGAAQASPMFIGGLSQLTYENAESQYRKVGFCGVFIAPNDCLAPVPGQDPPGYQRVNGAIPGNILPDAFLGAGNGDLFIGILKITSVTNANAVDPTFETSSNHRFNGYFVHEVASIAGAGATAQLNLTAGTDPFGVLSTGELFRFFAEAPNYSASNAAGGSLRKNIEMAVGDTTFNGIIVQDPTKLWASFGVPSVASGTTDAGEGYAYTATDLTAAGSGTSVSNAFFALDKMVTGPQWTLGALNKINDDVENAVGGFIADTGSLICTPGEIATPFVPGTVGSPNVTSFACNDFIAKSRINANPDFAGGLSSWQYLSHDPGNLNAIPEPGSLALMGVALAGLGLARRRRSI